jgi:mRNA interferase HigB
MLVRNMRTLFCANQLPMRIFSQSTIKQFWEKHPNSENNLKNWYKKMKEKNYGSLLEITKDFLV